MMAGVLVALVGGCANVGSVTQMPDEHVRYVSHNLSSPLVLPAVAEAPQAAGGPGVQTEAYIVSMSPSFQKRMGISEKLGRTLSNDECYQLVSAAKGSNEAYIWNMPHLTVLAGKTEVLELSTKATYRGDYEFGNGVWVPVFSDYYPSRVLWRVKATIEGETIALSNVAAISSTTALIDCSAKFAVAGEGPVRLSWSEPVRTTYSLLLDKQVRLKTDEGMIVEMSGTVERGYPGFCRCLSNIREKTGYNSIPAPAYLLTCPPKVLSKARATAGAM